MNHEVLALKWRPRSFDQIKGQDSVVTALKNSLNSNTLHNCYIFTGTRGVGKTSLARILAKAINCKTGISSSPCNVCDICTSIDRGDCPDVLEIDAASRTKVEDMRDLIDSLGYSPVLAKYKIFIIDEVHMLSNHSFNALLKTIEEPPAHVKFILATTEQKKIPATILSRSIQYVLRDSSPLLLIEHLSYILNAEHISYTQEALRYISKIASGSFRDAITITEQILSLNHKELSLINCEAMFGEGIEKKIYELLTNVIHKDVVKAMNGVRDLMQKNSDIMLVLNKLQNLIFNVSLAQLEPVAINNLDWSQADIINISTRTNKRDLQVFYQATINGARDMAYVPDQKIALEMIVLRMLAFQPSANPNYDHKVEKQSKEINTVAVNSDLAKPLTYANTNNPQSIESKVYSNGSIQQIDKAAWYKFSQYSGLQGLLKIIVDNCELISSNNELITLKIKTEHSLLLNDIMIDKLQKLASAYWSRSVKFHISITTDVLGSTIAGDKAKEQKLANDDAQNIVEHDRNIQYLKQNYGAVIDKIEILSFEENK